MRIVHYYPTAAIASGVTLALWSWARTLAGSGVDVAVVHADTGGGAGPKFSEAGAEGSQRVRDVVVPHRGSGRMTTVPVGLERVLDRDDVLVLHEGWVPSNLIAGRVARKAGIPYLVMPHGVYDCAWRSYLKPPLRVREWFERRLLERALAVHVFFPSEIPDVTTLAPRAAFITVPTGYQMPSERWIGGGGYVSWIGRIDPVHKGLDLLVEAIASMPVDERPTIRIHGYDYRGGLGSLERLIDRRGVKDWVDVRGAVSGAEKRAFLQNADGYVHPSRWECQSIAILENLALGVPSLISDASHIADEVRDADAALLAPPRVDALADGLRRLGIEGRDYSDRARALIETRFDWAVLVPQYLSELRELLATR